MADDHIIETLERFDDFAPMRNALRAIAEETKHWAGIPFPVENRRLVVEPKFPNADKIMELVPDEYKPPNHLKDVKIINRFWCFARNCEVTVYELDGKRRCLITNHGFHNISESLAVLDVSDVWGLEQEGRAVQLLGRQLRHRQFKQYLLTGMFPETSPRSNITYIFRKLRPTIALSTAETRWSWGDGTMKEGTVRILCTLCLHPIAYYEDSWAGAMCPTDDVLAHLIMMRGDERLFWARANQHQPWRPEAGL